MIFNPTVRQHQVQQKYLEAWCNENQQLWVYREENKKFFSTNTTNAFVTRGYYKLNAINEKEKQYLLAWLNDVNLSDFVANNPIRTLEDILQGMQKIYIEWDKVQNQEKNITLHLIDILLFCSLSFGVLQKQIVPDVMKEKVSQKILKGLAMQSIETYYCAVEEAGMPVITKILAGDSIDNDDAWGLVTYVCVQFFRTVPIGEMIETNKLSGVDMINIRAILQLILGFKFSNNMNNRKNHIQLLENVSSVRFITGSQPVINNYAIPQEMTEKLQLYFPISPHKALLITPDKDNPYSIKNLDDVSKVDEFNKKIIHYSDVLASKEKEDFERYWSMI